MLIERKRLILTLATLGGMVGIAGSIAIFFTIYIAFRILANTINPEQAFEMPAFFLPSFRQVLINYLAGFISVLILAPFVARRFLSPQYQTRGFTTTGFLSGAAAGLLCSWLVAFIHIVLLTISGIVNTGFRETFPWTLKLLVYYSSSSMILFGFLAAATGALFGSFAERFYRHFYHRRENGLAQL